MAEPPVRPPSEKGSALEVWKDENHTFYYPPLGTAIPEEPTDTDVTGRQWDEKAYRTTLETTVKEQNKIEKKTKIAVGKYPMRRDLPKLSTYSGTAQTILTNHFELKIGGTAFYEYEILDLEQGSRTKKKVQALFKKAVSSWDCLKDDQAFFATDGQKTIISWKKLHENLNANDVTSAGSDTDEAGKTWQQNITIGLNRSTPARFTYVGEIDVASLLQQSNRDLTQAKEDRSSIERCINILIAKSFDKGVIKLSRTKFFVRSARSRLGSAKLLEIIRGYYYTVKPGMGNILMNFNVATSAFFQPVLVSEFLADTTTFSSRVQRVAFLSKLHVYVEYQHKEDKLNHPGARIKKVTAIGDGAGTNIGALEFHKKVKDDQGRWIPDNNHPSGWRTETQPTRVVAHLKEVFSGVNINTNLEAVNVGSTAEPVWYAQELLRIVPYQLYTRPVPDHLTGDMVKNAAYTPAQSRWLIQNEGLRHLGFSEIKDELTQMVSLTIHALSVQMLTLLSRMECLYPCIP